MAGYFRHYIRFTDNAAKRYPANFTTHSYDALIADPDSQIRALLHFCGLPFDAAYIDFHRSGRAVPAPSSSQVGLPLSDATARAALYGSLLDELGGLLLR